MKIKISKWSPKVVDYTDSFHFDDNEDEEVYDDENQVFPDCEDEIEDEGNVLTNDLSDTEREIFHGCRIYDRVSPQLINKYFRIRLGSSFKYLHKQTACWLLTDSRQQLSSDRLVRVRNSGKD